MKKEYSIGITVHNFEHQSTLTLLNSLLEDNIKIDFIIYHQSYFKRILLKIFNSMFKRNSIRKNELLKKIKNIKTFNIKDINSEKCSRVFEKYKPSLVLCNTGIIKQKTIKNHPNTYLLNVHGSRLPEYRGASNLHWALWDSKDIYVTVHRINNGIDEGDILYQELLIKNSGDNIDHDKLSNLDLLITSAVPRALKQFLTCKSTFIKQDNIGNPMMRYYSMHPILLKILEKNYKNNE